MHLRMFGKRNILFVFIHRNQLTIDSEQAKDYAKQNDINLVGGYFSPVTDTYKKKV